MFESNLVDLDELVLMVRDHNSRSYIGEAINTYRSRAYRYVLLATWIAVAYDIISKIRALAVQSDPAAGAFVTALDNWIEQNERGDPNAVQKLQAIENELLATAFRDFEFFSAQERTDLERLKSDRNLCATPHSRRRRPCSSPLRSWSVRTSPTPSFISFATRPSKVGTRLIA